MGAQTSAHRDGKSQEDASAENLRSAVNAISEGDSVVESKVKQWYPVMATLQLTMSISTTLRLSLHPRFINIFEFILINKV